MSLGGSIFLRSLEEGGGNYGHHGSKAANNMIARLLAWDLYSHKIPVAAIHPGKSSLKLSEWSYGKIYN